MRNKLLILSIVAVIGVVGCSKEEEKAVVAPSVEQSQPNASAPSGQTAPAVNGAQAIPVQDGQANVQSQEQSSTNAAVPQSPASGAQTSPVVTVTNNAPAQAAPVSGNLPAGQVQAPAVQKPVEASDVNLTPQPAASAPINQPASTSVKASDAPAVVEPVKQ